MAKGKVSTQQEMIDELHDRLDDIIDLNVKLVNAVEAHQRIIEIIIKENGFWTKFNDEVSE